MNEASRTGRMCAAAIAALVAALLALVTAFAVVGTQAQRPSADPAPTRTTAAVAAQDPGAHADDGCVTTCVARARAHRDALGERTAPPGHLVTVPLGTIAAPARSPRAPPPSGHPSPSTQHTAHDPGRAPPTPPST